MSQAKQQNSVQNATAMLNQACVENRKMQVMSLRPARFDVGPRVKCSHFRLSRKDGLLGRLLVASRIRFRLDVLPLPRRGLSFTRAF